jgi:hypothetical protein
MLNSCKWRHSVILIALVSAMGLFSSHSFPLFKSITHNNDVLSKYSYKRTYERTYKDYNHIKGQSNKQHHKAGYLSVLHQQADQQADEQADELQHSLQHSVHQQVHNPNVTQMYHKNLVIVESPAKANTIEAILNNMPGDYQWIVR